MQSKRYRVIATFQDRSRGVEVTPEDDRFWPPAGLVVSKERIERLIEAGCLAPAGKIAAKEAATLAQIAKKRATEAEAKAEAARKAAKDAHEAADAAADLAEEAEAVAKEAAGLAELADQEEAGARKALASYTVLELETLLEGVSDGDELLVMLEEEKTGKARAGAMVAIEARLETLTAPTAPTGAAGAAE